MINYVKIEGRIIQILYSTSKAMRIVVASDDKFSHHKLKLTCFKPELFELIKSNMNNVMTFEGSFRENNYKDKEGQWHNDYCISIDKISNKEIEIKEEQGFEIIDEGEIPF